MQLIKRIYDPELAMLPIGDVFTMGPKEASIACEFLHPKRVIPMHYGTFTLLPGTPENLRDVLGPDSTVNVIASEPGEVLEW